MPKKKDTETKPQMADVTEVLNVPIRSQEAAQKLILAAALDPAAWPLERMAALLKTVVPEGATLPEVAGFLATAAAYHLDPLLGQIYLMKTSKGCKICVERDGFIAMANRQKGYAGFDTGVVRKNDEFRVDRVGSEVTVKHSILQPTQEKRGPIVGSYFVGYHEGRAPTFVYRDAEYYAHLKADTRRQPWQKYDEDMWESRLIAGGLRRMYEISNVYSRYELGFEEEDLPGGRDISAGTQGAAKKIAGRLEKAKNGGEQTNWGKCELCDGKLTVDNTAGGGRCMGCVTGDGETAKGQEAAVATSLKDDAENTPTEELEAAAEILDQAETDAAG